MITENIQASLLALQQFYEQENAQSSYRFKMIQGVAKRIYTISHERTTIHNNDPITAYKAILKQTFNTFALDNIYHLDEARLITQTLTLMAMAILLQDKPDGSTLTVSNILNTLMPGVKIFKSINFDELSVSGNKDNLYSQSLDALLHSIHKEDQAYENQIAYYLSKQESAILIPDLKDASILKKLLQMTNLLEKLYSIHQAKYIILIPQFAYDKTLAILDKEKPDTLAYNPLTLKHRCIIKNAELLRNATITPLYSTLHAFIKNMEECLDLNLNFKEEYGIPNTLFKVFFNFLETLPEGFATPKKITETLIELKSIIQTPGAQKTLDLHKKIQQLKEIALSEKTALTKTPTNDSIKKVLEIEYEKSKQIYQNILDNLKYPLYKNNKQLFISNSLLSKIIAPCESTPLMLSELSFYEILALTTKVEIKQKIIRDLMADFITHDSSSIFHTMDVVKLDNIFRLVAGLFWSSVESNLNKPFQPVYRTIFQKITTFENRVIINILMSSYFNYLKNKPGFKIDIAYYKNYLEPSIHKDNLRIIFIKHMLRSETYLPDHLLMFFEQEPSPIVRKNILTEILKSLLKSKPSLKQLDDFCTACTSKSIELNENHLIDLNKTITTLIGNPYHLTTISSPRNLLKYASNKNRISLFNLFYKKNQPSFSEMVAIFNYYQDKTNPDIINIYSTIQDSLMTCLNTPVNTEEYNRTVLVSMGSFIDAYEHIFPSEKKETAFQLFLKNHIESNLTRLNLYNNANQFAHLIKNMSENQLKALFETMTCQPVQGQPLIRKISSTITRPHTLILGALKNTTNQELVKELTVKYVTAITSNFEKPISCIINFSNFIAFIPKEEISALFNAYGDNIIEKIGTSTQLISLLNKLEDNPDEKRWLSEQICQQKLHHVFEGTFKLSSLISNFNHPERANILNYFIKGNLDWSPSSIKDAKETLNAIHEASLTISNLVDDTGLKDTFLSKLSTSDFIKKIFNKKTPFKSSKKIAAKFFDNIQNIDQSSAESFQSACLDYLKKPIEKDALSQKFEALKQLQSSSPKIDRQGQPCTKKSKTQQPLACTQSQSAQDEHLKNIKEHWPNLNIQHDSFSKIEFAIKQKPEVAETLSENISKILLNRLSGTHNLDITLKTFTYLYKKIIQDNDKEQAFNAFLKQHFSKNYKSYKSSEKLRAEIKGLIKEINTDQTESLINEIISKETFLSIDKLSISFKSLQQMLENFQDNATLVKRYTDCFIKNHSKKSMKNFAISHMYNVFNILKNTNNPEQINTIIKLFIDNDPSFRCYNDSLHCIRSFANLYEFSSDEQKDTLFSAATSTPNKKIALSLSITNAAQLNRLLKLLSEERLEIFFKSYDYYFKEGDFKNLFEKNHATLVNGLPTKIRDKLRDLYNSNNGVTQNIQTSTSVTPHVTIESFRQHSQSPEMDIQDMDTQLDSPEREDFQGAEIDPDTADTADTALLLLQLASQANRDAEEPTTKHAKFSFLPPKS